MVAMALAAGATLAAGAMASSSANKASKAQQQSADASLNLQREQFDITREDSLPFLRAGQNANAAYAYEMGLGPRPTYDAAVGSRLDAANALTIGSQYTPGTSASVAAPPADYQMDPEWARVRGLATEPTAVQGRTEYTVGNQSFATRDEAQAYIDAQREEAAKATGGNFDYQGYKASPGYDYRLAEGEKAIQRAAAARGNLNSGATLKALGQFGQDYAANDYGLFMNRLAAQAGMGQTQANSMAGLGANYAANGSNTLMAAGNARASGYVNQGNVMGSALGQLGQIGGNYLGGSSFGGGSSMTPHTVAPVSGMSALY
jgi:hypothetical protein